MSVKLDQAVAALDALAPPHLAEPWDNVGLLIRPTRAARIDRALLTIDLTESVLAEAIDRRAKLVVAYHPPIFAPLKTLRADAVGDAAQRIAVGALEAGVAVYSPHTALDAIDGGVNDWLCDGLGEGGRMPLKRAAALPPSEQCKLVTFVPPDHADRVRDALAEWGAGRIGGYTHCSYNTPGFGTFLGGAGTNPTVGERGQLEWADEIRIEMVCARAALPYLITALRLAHPYEEPAYEVHALEPRPATDTGVGRIAYLDAPVTIKTLVARVKKHLKLKHVRVAGPDARLRSGKVHEIAVCAGAGGSVFADSHYQVYLTGEMRHHDVLAKVARGSVVILTDHTHTERGYLPTLRKNLRAALDNQLDVDLSKRDADPLHVM